MNTFYSVRIEPRAWSKIMSLDDKLQERVLTAIEDLENNPRPSRCKKLKGPGGKYRVRVSDQRIIYTIQDDVLVVLVVQVGKRDEVY